MTIACTCYLNMLLAVNCSPISGISESLVIAQVSLRQKSNRKSYWKNWNIKNRCVLRSCYVFANILLRKIAKILNKNNQKVFLIPIGSKNKDELISMYFFFFSQFLCE